MMFIRILVICLLVGGSLSQDDVPVQKDSVTIIVPAELAEPVEPVEPAEPENGKAEVKVPDKTDDSSDKHQVKVIENRQPANLIFKQISQDVILHNVTSCHILPKDPKTHEKITKAVNDGARLITYTLNFPDYDVNPLLVDMGNNYKSNIWERTFDLHAYTLLSFPFNYKVLSLSTLSYGTEEMMVPVVDSPSGCLETLSAQDKLASAADVVLRDFKEDNDMIYGEKPQACHQYIYNNSGAGMFEYQCCELRDDDLIQCHPHKKALWVEEMYKFILVMQVLAFLFGPIFIKNNFFDKSLKEGGYEVKLEQPIQGTVNVNFAAAKDGKVKKYHAGIRRPALLDARLEEADSSGTRNILIKTLMIYVDQSSMTTEASVPVGFFKFLYNDVLMCGLKRWEPFTSCFKAGLFGPLKCCGLGYLTWGALLSLLGGLLAVVILPIPYYIRLAVYYTVEEDELDDRRAALNDVGLVSYYEQNLLYYLSPTHPLFVVVIGIYVIALPLMALLKLLDKQMYRKIVVEAFRDLDELHPMEAFRLFLSYMLLPVEKFGLCGLLVGVIYWPFAIPFFLLIVNYYCIPAFYMMGRFILLNRPEFFKRMICPFPSSHALANLQQSTLPYYDSYVKGHKDAKVKMASVEDALLLNNISPRIPDDQFDEKIRGLVAKCMTGVGKLVVRVLMSLTSIALLFSVLVVFSEVIGFFIEVIIFTIMGAIVNANSSAKFIAVIFWLIAYCTSCFNSVYAKYKLLNEMIFKQVQDKLHERIRAVTRQRTDKQLNHAFKYLTAREETELHKDYFENVRVSKGKAATTANVDVSTVFDRLEYQDDQLVWKVNSLVMFVDKKDKPRIPVELFQRVSDEDKVPDCPGSVPHNMVIALKQLLYMVIFLAFVTLVVVTFHQVYDMTTTNQLLLTLGGGFVPFLVKRFLQPTATQKSYDDKGFISYAFEGKLNEIVEDFQQTWPVYDFDFEYVDDPNAMNDGVHFANATNLVAEEPNGDVKLYRAPKIHLNFNVPRVSPKSAMLVADDNRGEPIHLEELKPLTQDLEAPKRDEIDADDSVKAQDTIVMIDFVDGKCNVRKRIPSDHIQV